jgi:hypothetical protein
MNLSIWSTNITVIDDFVLDENLIATLKQESLIPKTVEGQNKQSLSLAQMQIKAMVNTAVINYCIENEIEYSNLEFGNLQRGCLNKYDESMVSNHLYEPHHDMVEGAYVTALYYVDSDWSEDRWVGGELTLYKQLTFADYPENIINILPKPNRLIIFPGFVTHRVKPYFGDKPRTSLVFGWSVDEPKRSKVITI